MMIEIRRALLSLLVVGVLCALVVVWEN